MSEKKKSLNWSELPDGAREVLGDHFWDDIKQLIPLKGPAVDMFDLPKERVIMAELPGLHSTEQIQLKLNGHELLLEGTIPSPIGAEKYLWDERFKGSFHRKITLPFPFGKEDVSSTYQNGILTIRIKKKQSEGTVNLFISE
ncbi:Hsp20/alpha crystallin family protein [Cytobacillus gottheilii]|uniref:Hsp20/alpha crystallin family protein n=1 Tax=Cytobacillus gottheilii TaxID=859144 RepID=UPI003CF3439E